MGLLRLYLGLCVVAGHSSALLPWAMHDGRQAVQTFYIISGFYMGLVLSTKYDSKAAFYRSRALRIFIPYFAILAFTLLVCVGSGLFLHDWLRLRPFLTDPTARNGIMGIVVTSVSNLTLIGQDAVLFLSQQAGERLHPTANFLSDEHPLWDYVLIPPAWSISLELMFYALAPFLNALRTRTLLFVAAVATVGRCVAYVVGGLAHDPWTYRFFPFEIALFIGGILVYRFYAAWQPDFQRWTAPLARWPLVGYGLLLLALCLHAVTTDLVARFTGREIAILASHPIWLLAIPLLFAMFSRNRTDRLIGEWSFPLYLVHYIVIALLAAIGTHLGTKLSSGIVSAAASMAVAIFFYRTIVVPIDSRRHAETQGRR